VNPLKHLLFILRQRRAGNRVSFSAYIKAHAKIHLGTGCKIHADASVDASRSAGVSFGDKVTLNRFAYVQGGNAGVLGDKVHSAMFAGCVAKGFAVNFSLIHKNIFFFHRPKCQAVTPC
jgi:hypothetical protein